MLDLETVLKFPTTDNGWKRKVLIGGILNIFPVINFLPIGYAYRLFQKSLHGRDIHLPEWENWGDLFVQGLIVFLIGLIYSLAWLLLMLVHPVLGVLGFIAVAFVFPAALVQHAVSRNLSQALQLGEVWATIQRAKGDYFTAWLVTVAISLLLAVVGLIPIVGYIISAVIGFYTYLVFAVLFGRVCTGSSRKRGDSHSLAGSEE